MTASPLLSDLLERYLRAQERRGLSPNTIKHCRNSFRLFACFVAGQELTACQLTTDLLTDFAHWLRRTPVEHPKRGNPVRSPHAIDGHLNDLRAFVHWAQEADLVDRRVKVRYPPKPKTLVAVLTDQQLRAIDACSFIDGTGEQERRNRAIVSLLLDTGVRLAELCGLTMRDLYVEDRMIQVVGKGNKERRIPFSRACQRDLEAWLQVRGAEAGPVFQLSRSGVQYLLTQIEREVGFRVHAHLFRHTAATRMLQGGMDIAHVKRMLGHTNIKTTERYTHLVSDDLRDKLDEASPLTRFEERTRPQVTRRRRLQRDKYRASTVVDLDARRAG